MNVAQAIFGALCAAETDLWNRHLDELLALFIREFSNSGGPVLQHSELKLHVQLFAAMMALAWILGHRA